MTIEERVEQLEAQVAQLTGEGDYTLLKSGETIDAILDGIETAAIYHGSDTVVSDGSSSSATAALSLGFTATENTKVAATVRKAGGPSPVSNAVLQLYYTAGRIYANLTPGYNHPSSGGMETVPLPSGTYYIDWICIDKGVS
ncbi:MAG: hypothetical protein IJ645_00070 [Ruminococcus sp.]|nr:hypothetical protein [Ruminococcus sp.]